MVENTKVCCIELDNRSQLKYTIKSHCTTGSGNSWKENIAMMTNKQTTKHNAEKKGLENTETPKKLSSNRNSKRRLRMTLRNVTRLFPCAFKKCRFCASTCSTTHSPSRNKFSAGKKEKRDKKSTRKSKSCQINMQEQECSFCHKIFKERRQMEAHAPIHFWREKFKV